MKQWTTTFAFLAFSIHAHAQAPQKMSFQAVLRDDANALIVNGAVGLRISVLQGSETGTPVYVETHSSTTNANGLATLVIGDGNAISGDVATIDWANGPYYLKTETDPTGGTAYSIVGTTQLLSVPYALHAANNMQGPAGPQGPQGEPGCDIVRAGNMIVVYNATNAYGFYQSESSGSLNSGLWSVANLSGDVIGAEASENKIVVYTTTNAYGFYQSQSFGGLNSGLWSVANLAGTVLGAVSNKNQVVVYTDSNAYGFYQSQSSGDLNSGLWSVANLAGTVIGAEASRQQIVVFTTSNAYGFYQSESSGSLNSGLWSVANLSAVPVGTMTTR